MRILAACLLAGSVAAAQSPYHGPPAATPLPAPIRDANSGKTIGPADVLQEALNQHLYFAMAFAMQHVKGMKPEQDSYFSGMLAFHEGRFEDARKALITAVNTHGSVLTSNQIESALETLGDTARLTSHYGACAQMYDDIDRIWGARLGAGELDIKQKRHLCAVQQHTPVQTIDFGAPFIVQRNGMEYPVRIGDKQGMAEIDTGAAETVITESTARAWGVVPADAIVVMHGYSGGTFTARPAVVPALTIGTATLHNVAVLVAPDQQFYIAPIKLQIHALLGLPVVMALGRLTFAQSGALTVAPPSATTSGTESGAKLWLGTSQLLVEMNTVPVLREKKIVGSDEPRLFALDTGSGSSYFTDHYLREHANLFTGPPLETARLAGAGGETDIPAYAAPNLPLWSGPTMIALNGPHVLTASQGGEIEPYEGLIGQDTLRTLKGYTIDLRSMRFSVQP